MPVMKSQYPGVHVFEVASGVNTISGVSTSVTAFVGAAKRGPVNKAIRILGFADFERRFGGLEQASELSYAIRQFFLNGGGEAWIVRVALESASAQLSLVDSTGRGVLTLTARDEGEAGNWITAEVDYQTPFPASTFNLTIRYDDPNNPADNREESFTNLSMDQYDLRYVVDVVNSTSELVTAVRNAQLDFNKKGESQSAPLLAPNGQVIDLDSVVTRSAKKIRVAVDDLSPLTVEFNVPLPGSNFNEKLEKAAAAIQTQVRAMNGGNESSRQFECRVEGNKLKLTSGVPGESSRVRVLPAATDGVSMGLVLGSAAGGIETDGSAQFRPAELLAAGRLVGAARAPTDFAALPSQARHQIKIQLDGGECVTVSVGTNPADGNTPGARLRDLAVRLERAVRSAQPATSAFKAFTCRVDSSQTSLVLTSGTRSLVSAVAVQNALDFSISSELGLITNHVVHTPSSGRFSGGIATDPQSDMAAAILKSRNERLGLYALESVDLFNILCLPGVTSTSVLGEAVAYCEERRAFLLVDPPPTETKPEAIERFMTGPNLPRSDHAAVYYPWLKIPDPLKNGKLRSVAPCGTVAGLFARTDSTRGVWKAPAGTEASMRGVQATDYLLTDPENGVLNPRAVNCLRIFSTYGPIVWGSRTLRGDDNLTSEYKYVPVRRLALYLAESLCRGLKWVVFEPNDEPLWAQIRLNVGSFLQTLFRQGAFQGKSPQEAYFVKCDAETTTQTDINLGRVNVVIGFAPLKPAEFVIVTIQQIAGRVAI